MVSALETTRPKAGSLPRIIGEHPSCTWNLSRTPTATGNSPRGRLARAVRRERTPVYSSPKRECAVDYDECQLWCADNLPAITEAAQRRDTDALEIVRLTGYILDHGDGLPARIRFVTSCQQLRDKLDGR